MAKNSREATLEWLSSLNLAGFKGLWIVAHNRRILAKAPTLEQALKDAALDPDVIPFIWRVPADEKLAL